MSTFLALIKAILDFHKEFANKYELPDWLSDITLWLSFIIVFGSFAKFIWEIFHLFRKMIRNHKLDKDLYPFGTHKDVAELNRNYVKTRLLKNTPSDYGELLEVAKTTDKKKTTTFKQFYKKLFQEDNDTRFYFILGESGLGKTTFLMNLFSRYNGRFFKKYKVKYIPLGHPFSIAELEKLKPSASSTILFIDGLDEMNNSASPVEGQSFEKLSAIFFPFRMVVVSCRTQFYNSQESEPLRTIYPTISPTGYLEYDKYYVSPFDRPEVSEYLRRRYNLFLYRRRKKAYRVVLSAINLMVRPFLLKNIEYLLSKEAGTEDYGYSLGVYKTLIDQWIERDVSRIVTNTDRDNHRSNILPMLSELALISFTKGITVNNYYLSESEIYTLAAQYNISIDFIKVRSLLNRDTLGNIKFAHKSVLEYFIALRAIEDPLMLAKVRANPSFDVANVFIDEHDFFTKIRPIISNFDGYYFEHNLPDQKQLDTITWSSMYTVNSLYLTKFDLKNSMSDIFGFRKLKEVVFLITADNVQLSDLYLLTHNCWFEFLDTIGSVLDELYLSKVRIDEAWLILYRNLYHLNMKEIQGEIFFHKAKSLVELNAIDKIWFDQQFDQTLAEARELDASASGNPFDLLVRTMYNEKLIALVQQLSELTITKVRTMVDRKTNIGTYSLQASAEVSAMDERLRRLNEAGAPALRKMDVTIQEIRKTDILQHPGIRIYY